MSGGERRFLLRQILALALAGLALLWLSWNPGLDFKIARWFYSPKLQRFPWQHNRALVTWGHDGLKWLALSLWLGVVVTALASPHIARLRAWTKPLWLFAAMALTGASAVALLKSVSAHPCPWELDVFGGAAQWHALFDAAAANRGSGRCWPGGHASGGFALIAGYFAFRDVSTRWARLSLVLGLTLGAIMSLVQMVRGAHFLSHNLWSLWIVWACCVGVYSLIRRNVFARQKTCAQ